VFTRDDGRPIATRIAQHSSSWVGFYLPDRTLRAAGPGLRPLAMSLPVDLELSSHFEAGFFTDRVRKTSANSSLELHIKWKMILSSDIAA
jgi:hypothetical protein